MFTSLNDILNLAFTKCLPTMHELLRFESQNLVNLNAANGSMLNHFESARISFNQNGELFLIYGLVILVSFIIGVRVYFLTHTKAKKNH